MQLQFSLLEPLSIGFFVSLSIALVGVTRFINNSKPFDVLSLENYFTLYFLNCTVPGIFGASRLFQSAYFHLLFRGFSKPMCGMCVSDLSVTTITTKKSNWTGSCLLLNESRHFF